MGKQPPKYITVTCGHCEQTRQVPSGAWLRWDRERHGVGLREFARKAGFSAPFISDVERNNRLVTPRLEKAYATLLRCHS